MCVILDYSFLFIGTKNKLLHFFLCRRAVIKSVDAGIMFLGRIWLFHFLMV